jgi:hypothetical protein
VEVKKAGRYRIDAMYSHDFPHAGRQLLTLHYKQGNNLAYFDFMPEDKQGERASNPRLNHCQLTGDLQSTTIEWNRFQDRATYVWRLFR